jgi:hypothetical protein
MRNVIIAIALVALCACKVQKVGKDTYKVVTPTKEQTQAAAKKTGEELKQEAHKIGKKIEHATDTHHR